MEQVFDILLVSIRDGFVQVSAFVAITVLLFSYVQYRTGGRVIEFLEDNRALQPIAGGLLGLTPGCGGAIVVMPLYIRGTVSFGTVVATLCATAGDSAFVILAVAPEAALYAYGIAFVAGVGFGYMIDAWGLGVARIDRAVEQIGHTFNDEGFATSNVASDQPSVPDKPDPPSAPFAEDDDEQMSLLARISHAVHVVWWVVAVAALFAGVEYLRRGAPEVPMEFGPNFFGVFTVAGLVGTTLSFFLYFVGRYEIDDGDAGRIRESFASTYETLKHAAMETSMVTVWVIAAYLLYEYTMVLFAFDIRALSESAGLFAPIAGVALGLVPGCGPQIVFAGVYANGGIPFSALVGNAISQDGDALFPLMAVDIKAALIASIYTTVPAAVASLLVYYGWPFAEYGFGVLK
jgi:hypothetical protein